MQIHGWRYYNHAAIPTTAPHFDPDTAPITDKSIWKIRGGTPLLARWTTDFDCQTETNWWYCIKDTPFDLASLKAKRRYEINKGNKNFIVKEISPADYPEDLYRVTASAYETYPKSYRPNLDHANFIEGAKKWNFYKVYGAFSVEDGALSGYSCLKKEDRYLDFRILKADPEKEKLGVNAAVVCKILIDHESFLQSGGYLCDGERSILHETAFQDYLEKYFGFRKAYCRLNMEYHPKIKGMIKLLYPLRKIVSKLDSIGIVHRINAILKMEEIVRGQRK